jgi:pSer/pThr/pTyr-binding forkhead associated (FHA) protein/tetratricopeptide (TPR) repeat protein
MAIVLMTDPSGRERECEVGSQPQVFGQGEDSDVVLGSRSVTRHHFKMWAEDGKIMVEDLTGGQGIRISGEAVSGVFELTPGARMEAGVFIFSVFGATLDTKAEAEMFEEAPPRPYLRGTQGPTRGVEIDLEDGECGVGRDPSLYLVIDDPSMSRLHARMIVRGGRTNLVDMRSSNGTFVNNKRIDSAELSSGDVVRFGNMEFKYVHGEAVSKGAQALGRKRMMLVAAGSVVGIFLLIVIGAKMYGGGGEPGPVVAVDSEDKIPLEVQVGQHLRSEALELMRKIPKDSVYHKRVKYKIAEIEKKLRNYHLTEGKSYYTAQQFRKSYKHFLAYMGLNPCDQKVYEKWVQAAESKMRRFKHYGYKFAPYVFDCPEDKQAGSAEAGRVDLDPGEVMRSRYSSTDIYKAMMFYYRGKAQMAIQSVRRLKALSDKPEIVEKAKEIERYLMIIDGKYNEGVSLLLRGELADAREDFRIALDSDAKIVPKSIRSYYREEIGKQLAGKLYKEGLERFARKRLREAFEHWQECLKIHPDGTDCMRGLNELEREAEGILNEAKILESRGDKRVSDLWKTVLTITRPESFSYRRAQLKLEGSE